MHQKVLVTLGGGYADVILATPVIAFLHARGYAVDALVESHQPEAATLLSGWDALDSIYLRRAALRRNEGGRGYRWVVRTVHHQGAPLGLGEELRPTPRAAGRPVLHESLINLSALRPLGWDGESVPAHVEAEAPEFALPTAHAAFAPGWRGVGRRNLQRKAWPHWQSLGDRFHAETGMAVFVLGVEEDSAAWMDSEARPWLHNLCGQIPMRTALGILARARAVVAVDNALAHAAAALDRPVCALFGATDERRRAPVGPRVRTLSADVPCRPCQGTPRFAECRSFDCMAGLSVHTVLSSVLKLVEAP